jgi:hypothetical protein
VPTYLFFFAAKLLFLETNALRSELLWEDRSIAAEKDTSVKVS